MTTKSYPSDLTDPQWAIIQEILQDTRKRKHSLRDILDSVFYIVKGGIQWRMLPLDKPPWQTVYYYHQKWRSDGTWDLIHEALRAKVRKKHGRDASPSVGLIDSQSVKTSQLGGSRGFDNGKNVKGVKRQIVVDTLGLLLAVVVHRADISDKRGGEFLLNRLIALRFFYPRLRQFFADQAYKSLSEWLKKNWDRWRLDVIKRPKGAKGFVLLPKRWIVERTFAWMTVNRRLEKNYERKRQNHELMLKLAMIRIMINRF